MIRIAIMCFIVGVVFIRTSIARPHVIMIYVDDQKRGTIHALGNDIIHTPNLDRMAREGTYFSNCYIAGANSAAVCIPSRAMLLSGRTLHRSGKNVIAGTTMPQNMLENGYESWHFGKWHNDKKSHLRSFTGGHAIGGVGNCRPGNVNWEYNVCPFDPTGAYDGSEAFIEEGVHATTTIINPTIDSVLHYQGSQPFFMYIAPHAPHDPRTAPQEYHDKYPPERIPIPPSFMEEHPFPIGEYKTVRDEKLVKWPRTESDFQKENSDYYAIIEHLDHEIGRLFHALDSTGLMDSTIIAFAGDHGLGMGEHGLYGKQNLYEHTTGAPLLIMGPGVPEGKVSDALVYLLDVYPTLMELAEVEIPDGVEGKSLVPVLDGLINDRDIDVRNSLLYAYKDYARGARDQRFKLIENFQQKDEKRPQRGYQGSRHTQLFDLWKDPWELTNLADDPAYADTLLRLRKEISRWHTEWGDSSALMRDWVGNYPAPEGEVIVQYGGSGCMDTSFTEYDSTAIYQPPGACQRPVRITPKLQPYQSIDVIINQRGVYVYETGLHSISVYDMKGVRRSHIFGSDMGFYPFMDMNLPGGHQGIFLIKVITLSGGMAQKMVSLTSG